MASQTTVRPAGTAAQASGWRGALAEVRWAAPRLLPAAALLWGLLCGIGYLLTHPLKDTSFEDRDASVNPWLARHRTDTWNSITEWLTYLGETITVIAIGVVCFVALRLALGRWRESMFLATALAGQATIFLFTTLTIERDRPSVPRLDSSPPTTSFPSGHMSAATTLYVGLAVVALRITRQTWLRALAIAGAIVLPLCVAFARLYRGMHFVTDVSASVVLASLWLTVAWAVILRGHGDRAEAAR